MRIFISYHTPDGVVANRIAEAIKAHWPAVELFFAPKALSAGAYWLPRLAQEIKDSHAIVVLIGKRVGKWQELEYLEAVRLSRDTGKPLIVPVVIGDYAPGLPFFDQYHRLFFREPASKDAIAAILRALDGVPEDGAPPLWAQFNPYRGLAAFTSADAAFFFGREALTTEILTFMQNEPSKALALIGNSGVGKSSLAQAGVIAALKRQELPTGGAWPAALSESRSWLPLTIRPEDKPLKSLALAFTRLIYERSSDQDADAEGWVRQFRDGAQFADLMRAVKDKLAQSLASDAPRSFFLYIDQGEELYASTERERKSGTSAKIDAEAFSRLIAEAAGRSDCHVFFSLRSDYYGRLQSDEALFAVSRRIDVPPMASDALRQAMERPATALAVHFEPATMPSDIACAIAREAGALPLLAYLLSDMWRKMQWRGDGVMRFEEPPNVFDVSIALRERAECYRAENQSRERDLKRLFTLRLTLVLRSGDVIKRRARRAECSADEWNIAEELAGERWRLVTLDGGSGEVMAEVAHEQLLRSWPTLADWVEERRKFLIWKSDLEASRLDYDNTPPIEKTAALLMGRRLSIAREWFSSHSEDLAPSDRQYILDSIVEEDKAREELKQAYRRVEKGRWRAKVAQLLTAAIAGGVGVLSLEHLYGISGFNIFSVNLSLVLVGLAMLIALVLITQVLQINQISGYLTLAERELNSLLRGWGGGLSMDARERIAREFDIQLQSLPLNSPKREELVQVRRYYFEGGGPQAASMGKARMTAFLLREIYEGKVAIAQKKIEAVKQAGISPFVAPGVRELVGFDQFDSKKARFSRGAGVSWLPLMMAVKLHRHPRHIIMVKPDKTVLKNWDVIDQLNRQLAPTAM